MEEYLLPESSIPSDKKIGSFLESLYNKDLKDKKNKWLDDYISQLIDLNFEDVIKDFLTFVFRYSSSSIMLDTICDNVSEITLHRTCMEGDVNETNDPSCWDSMAKSYEESGVWSYYLRSYKRPDKMYGSFFGITEDILYEVENLLVLIKDSIPIDDTVFLENSRFNKVLNDFCKSENLYVLYVETKQDNKSYLDLRISWIENPAFLEMPSHWKAYFKELENAIEKTSENKEG